MYTRGFEGVRTNPPFGWLLIVLYYNVTTLQLASKELTDLNVALLADMANIK